MEIQLDRFVSCERYSEVLGSVRLSSGKVSRLAISTMAEEDDSKGLLDGRGSHTRSYSPPNENDGALFHEKGKSPKEVSFLPTIDFLSNIPVRSVRVLVLSSEIQMYM